MFTSGRSRPYRSGAEIAAAQSGYHPAFQIRRPGEPLQRVELQPLDAPAPDYKPADRDQEQRKQLAAHLLQRVDKPSANDSLNRLALYYRAAAWTDFETTLADVASLKGAIEEGHQLVQLITGTDGLDEQQLRAAEQLLEERDVFLLFRQIDQIQTPEQKLELLGEALLLVEQLTGDQALTTTGYLAHKLYEAGENESAGQLLQDAFAKHEKLKLILANQERQAVTGVARTYLPVYAVVDPQVSFELIGLTAPVQEIARLQTLAIRCAVEYGGHDPESLCRQLGIDTLSAEGMTTDLRISVKHRDVKRGLALANHCPDEPGKADFLFELAKHLDGDHLQKIELAQSALDIMRFTNAGPTSIDPEHWLAERVRVVASWDARLGQQYAFESLWLPPTHSTITPHYEIAHLAQQLAGFDAALARALIEPCFEDWSWLFDERDVSVMFTSNPPLQAAAAIDADWTLELVDDLFSRHLPDHPSRRLEIIYGLVRSLAD